MCLAFATPIRLFGGKWDRGDAIYLHRIVVNPEHKGKKQFKKVLDWAIDDAKAKNLSFVRMDTWGR